LLLQGAGAGTPAPTYPAYIVNVDFGGNGDGVRVIYDRNGQNAVRIVVSATYSYHPSGDVSQIVFAFRVADDQTNLDQTGGLDGDAQGNLDPMSSGIAKQILAGLEADFQRLRRASAG
jgi:hypothetical protein